ncbi:tryptophan biosynthesis modulator TrpM [Streptomyces sp. NPDC058272]|uniref:tryptophan biosynthesis modulator TrpM n=1 Tax=Streptomyces sp. NPDC058272 TaxID=3346415 RepID=UPI0036E2437D
MPNPTHAPASLRPGLRPDGEPARVGSAAPAFGRGDTHAGPADPGSAQGGPYAVRPCGQRPLAQLPGASAARDPYARLARGCRPRGCRAPARRVHGRRVRYVIGDEPGQVNGMRWPARVRALALSPACRTLRVR